MTFFFCSPIFKQKSFAENRGFQSHLGSAALPRSHCALHLCVQSGCFWWRFTIDLPLISNNLLYKILCLCCFLIQSPICIQNPCSSIKIFSVNSSEFLILLDLFMPFFNEFPMNSAQIMVNLIPYNPTASGGFQAPKHQRVERPFIARILRVDSCGDFELGKWQFSHWYDDHWWSDFFESLM